MTKAYASPCNCGYDVKSRGKPKPFHVFKDTAGALHDSSSVRKPPKSAPCVRETATLPEASSINRNEIFLELTQIMELQKLGLVMEQDTINRLKILHDLNDAKDGFENVSSEQPNSEATGNKTSEYQKQETTSKDREALLVLRSDLIVPELRDFPTLHEMLTVPTTLTQATRMIFSLRKDMLALRNALMQRALAKSEEQIEMCRKRRFDRQERLLQELSKVFSKAQLDFFCDAGRPELWSLEDYLQSISLRSLCRHDTFEYVRNTMKIPLPSMRSVRSMAYCGLMPEVTKRYKELAETNDLRVIPITKKRARSADDRTDSDSSKRQKPEAGKTMKRVARGSGSVRSFSKRKQKGRDEHLSQTGPLRPCWDTYDLEPEAEGNPIDDESRSDWSDQLVQVLPVASPPRDRVRGHKTGRDRVRQRRGRLMSDAEWTGGKRGPREAADSVGRDEVGYSSDNEYHQTVPGGSSFSRKAPSHFSQMLDFGSPQAESAGWADALYLSQSEDWESPPRLSKKKKKGKRKKSSKKDRMVRLALSPAV